MSILKELRDTENALRTLQQRLDELKRNEQLIKELDFDKRLKLLMTRHGVTTDDILNFLIPTPAFPGFTTEEHTPLCDTPNKDRRVTARTPC
ncbi:hypothetical protein A244_25816 [Pseudomonas syringae pv. actinidiae ICMP 18807]|uniref:Uncharacterized protein n=1 Tax=Pseudomonas syringae pv. actinidiae ICMP 18807 TaxID=1194404 RepID=S6UTR3_PSESF|nr:hypothetical protein [Pseudomonas syringae]EPN45198.1 hypothetical protein A244_25816 [Pseudomonas syringae pv. actinidiae ICMP 18807]